MFWEQIQANRRRTILLFIVFALLVAVVSWALDYMYGGATAVVAAGLGAIQALVALTASDRLALLAMGVRDATPEESAHLVHTVEGLALAAQIPTPRCMIVDDPLPNAFATGLPHKNPTVCVTTGLLERLNRQEIEGVVAHEIAHIGNHDTRVMTVAFVLVGAIAAAAELGRRMLHMTRFTGGGSGGRRDSSRRDGGAQALLMVLALAAIILAPIVAQLLALAVSRNREYLADAEAVRLTRNPEGLIGALQKIADLMGEGQGDEGPSARGRSRGASRSTRTGSDAGPGASGPSPASPDAGPIPAEAGATALMGKNASLATAHLWFVHPFRSRGTMAHWFSTHPPIEKRIERLRQM